MNISIVVETLWEKFFNFLVLANVCVQKFIYLAPVVQTLDSAIHRIKIYPLDGAIGFRNTYPLDSDLSGG